METIDFNSIQSLKANGFQGFQRIGELFVSCQDIPDEVGVYFVIHDNDDIPEFMVRGSGGILKESDPNVSIIELERNWVGETKVIYIGQTGNSLRKRISSYMKFGQGEPVRHYGGRYIWQIKNHEDLLVCWKSLNGNRANPKQVESDLLRIFVEGYSCLPFSNLKK